MKKVYLTILISYIASFAAQPIYLHFYDSTLVNDAVVFLKDIAEIKGTSDENISVKFEGIEVGDAAPAGFSRYMNVYDIIQYVLKPKFKDMAIHTSGAKRVKIRTDAKIRCIGDYENQILDYLTSNICWNRDDYTVSIENSHRQWRCYRKPCTIEVKGLSIPYPKGNVRIKLKITQGASEFTVPVICKVRVQTPVVCASGSINRNQIINADNIELIKMDITAFKYTPYTEISSVIGKVAVKTLSPGTILHGNYVKAVPDICKGDHVFIIVKKGQIQVSVPARAREEGVKGESIWVENLKTHKLIRVKIAEKGIVHLNKGEAI